MQQTDLTFDCTCQNNSSPGLQFYTETLPTVRIDPSSLIAFPLGRPLQPPLHMRLTPPYSLSAKRPLRIVFPRVPATKTLKMHVPMISRRIVAPLTRTKPNFKTPPLPEPLLAARPEVPLPRLRPKPPTSRPQMLPTSLPELGWLLPAYSRLSSNRGS